MTEPQDETWQRDPTAVIDAYARSVRDRVVGATMVGLTRFRSSMDREYGNETIPRLEAWGTKRTRKADSEMRRADKMFRRQVLEYAKRERLGKYHELLKAETERAATKATEWGAPPGGPLDPQWSRQLSEAVGGVPDSTAVAIDDVLAGDRYVDEAFIHRSPGPGTLRHHPEAFDWLYDAVDSAADLAMPPHLGELYEAGRLQVTATAELLEAQRRLQDPKLSATDRSLLYELHAAAGAEHREKADAALGRWVTEYVQRFDDLAPRRLAEIVREAGLGAELGVTQRQAEAERARIRRANLAALRERLAAQPPWEQQPVPIVAAAKPGAAPTPGHRDPTPKPVSDRVADVPRNVPEIRVPTPHGIPRLHPAADTAATYGLPRPSVRAAAASVTAPAPTHLPAAGAGLPAAGKHPQAVATPPPSPSAASRATSAAMHAAAAANTRSAGGPQDITVPRKGPTKALAVARER
ncbi:hypothetical protein ACPA54_32140 [Uniformispora flossi]|uniref:hypothetical protein n=1 Tax=Uniformispora flossi TaxID=3390723 RepID=UPI003C2FE2C3